LSRDFVQSYEQLRHYDKTSLDFFKFAFSGYCTLFAAIWALHNWSSLIKINLSLLVSLICIYGFLIGFAILMLILKNRTYYVRTARYLNEQRAYFLKNNTIGFRNRSRMFDDCKEPSYFNWHSTHSIFIYLIILFNSSLFLLMIYSMGLLGNYAERSFIIGIFMWGSPIYLFQLFIAVAYLLFHEPNNSH